MFAWNVVPIYRITTCNANDFAKIRLQTLYLCAPASTDLYDITIAARLGRKVSNFCYLIGSFVNYK